MTCLCLILLLILSCSSTGRLEDRVVEYKLDNGMKWLLVKKGYAPVFAGVFQVLTGGADEVRGKTGIAHFLEHMAFKGTSEMSSEELWDIFTRNGAKGLNAYTSKDVTAYHTEMPNSKLELFLLLVSQMISSPTFTDFETEKNVILEEQRTSLENNPSGLLFSALTRNAFQKSPYGWPTIGLKDDVANATVADLENLYREKYKPECMVGSIVGDIDISVTKELINKYFAGFKRSSNVCQRTILIDPPQNELKEERVVFDSEPLLVIGFHKPTVPTFDDYMFDLFANIMCEGASSRLTKKIVQEKRLAKRIECFNSYPGTRLTNLFVIYAEPYAAESIDALKSEIMNELKLLKEKPVGKDEFDKAKNQMKAAFLKGIDSNFDLAETLVSFENVAGSWKYILNHPKNIAQIKPEDLIDAANYFFKDENMTVIELGKR